MTYFYIFKCLLHLCIVFESILTVLQSYSNLTLSSLPYYYHFSIFASFRVKICEVNFFKCEFEHVNIDTVHYFLHILNETNYIFIIDMFFQV